MLTLKNKILTSTNCPIRINGVSIWYGIRRISKKSFYRMSRVKLRNTYMFFFSYFQRKSSRLVCMKNLAIIEDMIFFSLYSINSFLFLSNVKSPLSRTEDRSDERHSPGICDSPFFFFFSDDSKESSLSYNGHGFAL